MTTEVIGQVCINGRNYDLIKEAIPGRDSGGFTILPISAFKNIVSEYFLKRYQYELSRWADDGGVIK